MGERHRQTWRLRIGHRHRRYGQDDDRGETDITGDLVVRGKIDEQDRPERHDFLDEDPSKGLRN